MSLVLGTNFNALVAQNSLASSGSALATSLQQLSSGLRINTAADDAAGYAIVQGMTSQIGGLNQASRNASDGVSLTQTASGALQEITNDLQTMRDLAVQSLNATNSAQDRVDLNQQFQQLSQDVDTVAKTAAFNGVNLLDGTFQGATFQIGANAGQTITVSSVASARTSQLGSSYTATVVAPAATGGLGLTAGALTLNGNAIVASVAGTAAGQTLGSAYAVAQAINNSQSIVTATANATTQIAAGAAAVGALANNDLIINGINVGVVAASGTAAGQAAADAFAINQVSGATGVTAVNNAGTLTLSAADGRDIIVTGTAAGTTSSGLALATTHGTVTLNSTAPTGITVAGTAAALTASGLVAATTAATLTGTSISNTDILSVGTANASLSSIDSALQQVAASGAQLGAYQNRFQSIITGINTTSSNLQAARSSIQDTDYAAATGQMSKAQILQQAGTAMVAQANMIPQNILSLLQKLP